MKIFASRNNLAIYFILFSIFFLLVFFNSFSYLRSSISDKLYGGKTSLENIVLLKIDDESINKIGRWPWNRNVFSELLVRIKDARAIGIDVSFFEQSENDSSLRETLNSLNNVVLASEINEEVLLKPIFSADSGYVNLITDSDGITRSVQSGLRDEIPFSFNVYKKAFGKNIFFEDKNHLINYASKPGSFKSFSVDEILEEQIDFKNKIVLIGATAPDLHDNYFVPTSKGIAMPGVEIHANILQNLILDNFLTKQERLTIILSLVLSSFSGFFIFSRLKIYYTIPVVLLIIVFYFSIGIFLFNNLNYLMDLFFFPSSLLIFTGAGIAVNYIEEKKHSAYLTEAFGKYVSKDLLKEILNKNYELKLGGEKKEITVFFSDIRGFTSISEKLAPEELVNLMNDYLTEMTKIILEHRGTVDKFIGDAIMAFWNAPFVEREHAKLACKSAIAQINSLKNLQNILREKNLPEIKIGCGINTGDAIIGNMGSEDRFDYTAIGDTVNLASRLEGLTKQYGVDIIISESTKRLIESEFICRRLDVVKVKGKKIPITIYELCTESDDEFIKRYESALELYLKSKFKEAKKEFEKSLKLKKDDKSSQMFIERCMEHIESPPQKDWDGSFEMKTK